MTQAVDTSFLHIVLSPVTQLAAGALIVTAITLTHIYLHSAPNVWDTMFDSYVYAQPCIEAASAIASSGRSKSLTALNISSTPTSTTGTCAFVPFRPAPFSLERIRKCLDGKHVYIGGNSISRHMAFVLNDILEGQVEFTENDGTFDHWEYRKDEMAYCGGPMKVGKYDDNPFECQFRVGSTLITFGGIQRIDSPALYMAQEMWERGPQTTISNWLLQWLSTPYTTHVKPDLMILKAGSDDLFGRERVACWQTIQQRETPRLVDFLRTAKIPVVWNTQSHICDTDEMKRPDKNYINGLLDSQGVLVLEQICQAENVRVADLNRWTHGRCSEYEDTIHFQALAFGHVFSILNDFCQSNSSEQPQ